MHDYGDLCQAITDMAHELAEPISADEFRTFNRCLDNGIADAVTEFTHQRRLLNDGSQHQTLNQRLGFLANDLFYRLSKTAETSQVWDWLFPFASALLRPTTAH